MSLDAREHHRPETGAALIAAAAAVVGSRNKLCVVAGISRRRLGYIEAGQRTFLSGRTGPAVISFAEQITLEQIIEWLASDQV